MAASQLFNGTVAHGGSQSVAAQGIPAKQWALAVTLLASYTATAGTTGVKLQVGASIDDGATFSDYADVVTAAPTANSASPVSAEVYASLDTYKAATHLRFKLVNLDATNDATATLQFRAAA